MAQQSVNEPIQAEDDVLTEVLPVSVMGNETLSAIVRSEIDVQIATAKAYPRSLSRFHKEVLDMATLNPEVAAECMYVLPRDGKKIDGPSARLAEIVLSAWGNSRGGARIVDESEEFITAQGFMHDLERNVAISFEVRRRITDRSGRRYKADMIGVTANAASSIAFRNAVFKVVPKAYWNQAYKAARGVVRGDVKTLADRRANALSTLGEKGVSADRVLAALGVQGIEDIGLDELVTLRGLLNAIEEGDTTIEQAFSPQKKQEAATAAPTTPPTGGVAAAKVAVGADQQSVAGDQAAASVAPSPAPAPPLTATAVPEAPAPPVVVPPAPAPAAAAPTPAPAPPKPTAPTPEGQAEKVFMERRTKEIREAVGLEGGSIQDQIAKVESLCAKLPEEWIRFKAGQAK